MRDWPVAHPSPGRSSLGWTSSKPVVHAALLAAEPHPCSLPAPLEALLPTTLSTFLLPTTAPWCLLECGAAAAALPQKVLAPGRGGKGVQDGIAAVWQKGTRGALPSLLGAVAAALPQEVLAPGRGAERWVHDGQRRCAHRRAGGMVMCGMVMCGMIMCGMVMCGMVMCGMVMCSMVMCGMVMCGMVMCGMVMCGMVMCGMVMRGMVMRGMVMCNALCFVA
ncbi:unnamed protein product [Closterium sp. NIES-64]|nr:unnamed protein product [Closterium sp. NIES-64]